MLLTDEVLERLRKKNVLLMTDEEMDLHLFLEQIVKPELSKWYERSFHNANRLILKQQQEFNLEKVSKIPGWVEAKGVRNGYVMLRSPISGDESPMKVALDFERHPCDPMQLTVRSKNASMCFVAA